MSCIRWPVVAAVLIALLLAACGGGGAGSADEGQAVEVAQGYFKALADGDYDRMVELSTGPAAVAARYGQQVQAADPEAFSARELEVTQPLVQREGQPVLDGALDLFTKGLDDRLRITEVAMIREGQAWAVSDYRRDGRALEEVFRDLAVSVTDDVAMVQIDLALTDDLGDVLLVPLVLTAGEQAVTVATDRTSAVVGSREVPLSVLEGEPTADAGSETPLALVFRDLDTPSQVSAISLALSVEGPDGTSEVVLDLPLEG